MADKKLDITFEGDFSNIRQKADQFREEQAKTPIRVPVDAGGATFGRESGRNALQAARTEAAINSPTAAEVIASTPGRSGSRGDSELAAMKERAEEIRLRKQINDELRMAVRVSRQRFETSIAGSSAIDRRESLMREADRSDIYDPLYAERLRTRAARITDDDGLSAASRGFFGRPSSGRIAAMGLLATHEAARDAMAYAMFDNPMLNRSPLQSLQTSTQVIQRMSSGIYGTVGRGILDVLDLAFNPDKRDVLHAAQGYGLLGAYSPMAMEAAQAGAMGAIARLGTQASLEQRRQANDRDNAAAVHSFDNAYRNPLDRFGTQRSDAQFRYEQTLKDLDNEGLNLRIARNSAQTDDDRAAADLELNAFNRQLPGRRKAASSRLAGELHTINTAQTMARADIQRSTEEFRLAGEGRFGLASERAFKRAQEDERSHTDVALIPDLDAKQRAQTEAHNAEIQESVKQRQGSTASDQLRLGRRYFEADLNDINVARDLALSHARTDEERDAINQQSIARENMRGLSEADANATIKMSIMDRRRLINYGLQRNTAGVEAGSIANAGLESAEQLRQAGKGWLATEQLNNTKLELDLYKRHRLESFEAVSFSRSYDDISNPKDKEDPAEVMSTIRDQVDRVLQYLADLASSGEGG